MTNQESVTRYPTVPFETIVRAKNGDTAVADDIVRHYTPYCLRISTVTGENMSCYVDHDLYDRLKRKILLAIFAFKL